MRGFRAQSCLLEFRGLGSRVKGCRVQGLGAWVSGLGSRVHGA